MYFVNHLGEPVRCDMTTGKLRASFSLGNPIFNIFLAALDENDQFYVLENGDELHIFDQYLMKKGVVRDSCPTTIAFVVHQNIKYSITQYSFFTMLDLEKNDATEQAIEITIGNKPAVFENLRAIAVDHKTHKLYLIDSSKVLEIPLKQPYQAEVIYTSSLTNLERFEGPSEIAVMDNKVYVAERVMIGNYYGYRIVTLVERIGWDIQRLLWIGHMKCSLMECHLARIPSDVIKYMIDLMQQSAQGLSRIT